MAEKSVEFLNLLIDMEDYIRDGYRSGRRAKPDVRETPESREAALASIAGEIRNCRQCGLCEGRTMTVPGAGCLDPRVMLIGEGPGAEEDKSGIPFVGAAGQYLDKWLSAVHLDREQDCFIGNVVKCRPPNNRDPLPEETHVCLPFLERQIDILRPRVILTLGRISTQILTGSEQSLGSLREKTFRYRGIPLIATYHPSGVLRNPSYRQAVWDDLKRLRKILDDV